MAAFRIVASLIGFLSCCVPGSSAMLLIEIDMPNIVVMPGSSVTITGIVTNPEPFEVFLNVVGGNTSDSELALDSSPFFLLAPFSLMGGESYAGALFTLNASGIVAPGIYFGTFLIQGGEDGFAADLLGTASFQAEVPSVPEPSTAHLAILGAIGLALTQSLRHRNRIRRQVGMSKAEPVGHK